VRSLLLAVALALCACARGGSTPASTVPSCAYALSPPRQGSWVLKIEARFEGAPGERLVAPEAASGVLDVALVEDGALRPLPRQGDAWVAPSCHDRCTVRYTIDLAAVAAGCGHIDCMRRVGDSFIGSAAIWMLRPDPMGNAMVHVDLRGGDASRFATGLRRDPKGGYAMRGRELGEASYTAFGEVRRSRVHVPGGDLDVAVLGPPLTMGDAAAVGWVKDAATCVAGLYGRFPAEATVFVVPVHGADEVVFGRVLSLAGGSVALLIGSETPASAEHGEWVIVHELSHLGTPSFMGEGHWLEEGLATYYEPVLRERAGWIREQDLWKHFVSQMPRGTHKDGEPPSLEERDDIDSTYWGGALFVFLADVRIRTASHGHRSFDDVLRASLDRLGDATHEATVTDFLRVGTEATGSSALGDMYTDFALGGGAVDLDGTWQALGVVPQPDGSITLRDDAPLAYVRRGIATGHGD
jgi:hypothetical protein